MNKSVLGSNNVIATSSLTSEPINRGPLPSEPEFVRVPDLFLLTGIKRGIAYRKINDGTFKTVLVREKGNKLGVRLIYWPSVKNYLHSLMAEQNPLKPSTRGAR